MSPEQPEICYGPDLAAIYHERWEDFARELWPVALRQVRARAPRAATWLDLCCGTGPTLRDARAAGFEVAGLDQSAHQLTQAAKNAPGAPLFAADVRRFDLARSFDVVSCFYDSFNYLLRKSDLLAAFRCARRHLAPGGVFIFDMNTLQGMRENWNHTVCMRGEGYTTIAEYTYDEDDNLGQGRFEGFIADGGTGLYRRYDETHYERGYESPEVEALLAQAGLRLHSRHDGYGGGTVTRKTEKILYSCGLPAVRPSSQQAKPRKHS